MNERDRKQLDLIGQLIKEGERLHPDNVQWLYRKVCDLAAPRRPDEFDFPSFAALVNTAVEKAFQMRFLQRLNLMKEVSVPVGGLREGIRVELGAIACEICEAVLAVRPWVRVHPGIPQEVFSQFRKCALTLSFDGQALVCEVPLDEFLLGPGDETFRARYASIRVLGNIAVFAAATCLENGESEINEEYGCFLGNKTRMTMTLSVPDNVAVEFSTGPKEWSPRQFPTSSFKISVGLTAAKYTTKAG